MDMDLEPGTLIDNRYVVEAEIGRGGMAAVYRVRHAQLGTHAAMKVLTMPAASIQKRLMHEGRVQAALQHPNIVAVSDVVVHNGAPALVMEYVRGPSLDDFLEKRRVTLAQADELARGILAGVAAAHKHGLIHRDLKPANIMLAITDSGLIPKVTDFGLVKMLLGDGDSSSRTRSGVAMGTPSYMAPEQISDAKTVDERADIFSLGAILYELLSNRRTFDDEDMFKVFSAIVGGVYTPIRELVPDIPERMELAIDGALMPDREARLPDVQTLLAVWMGEADAKGASLKPGSASTWGADLLEQVSDMGAGGESTGESLKRSLKGGLPNTRPTLPAPRKARHETGATFLPHPADAQADGTPAAPRTQSTMAPIPGMFDQPMPASVQRPASATAAPSHSADVKSPPYGLFAALVALLLIVGLVGVGGLAWVTGLFEPNTGAATLELPLPDPTPVPAPIEPTPDPEPTEAPELAPEPAPVAPVPTEPTPDPVPDPEPAPAPEPAEPQPEPVPEPEPMEPVPPSPISGPAVFINSPGVTVHLVNQNGRAVNLEKLGEGTYTVQAFFAGPSSPPTTFGPVTFSDGQSWQIKCVKGALKCNISQR